MDNQPSRPPRVSVNFSPIFITILVLAVGLYFLYHFGKSGGGARPIKWEYAEVTVTDWEDFREPSSVNCFDNARPEGVKGGPINMPYGLPDEVTLNRAEHVRIMNLMGEHGWEICDMKTEEPNGVASWTLHSFYFKRPKQ